MINIDRSSSSSVHDQLLEQLRYQIASGQYKVADTLPSTRHLAGQLGISFHTVRKVYQALEQEGLLESRTGAGYVVKERTPFSKAERMERGAAVVYEALQRLVGFGLEASEIEYLVQEQMALLEGSGTRYKLVVVAAFRELAEICAEQIKLNVQQPVEAATIDEFHRHRDADYVVTTYDHLRDVMTQVPRADVLGMVTYLRPDVLEKVSRLLEGQTLGIVTRDADAIPHLMGLLRALTGFSGQMLATSLDEGPRQMNQHLSRQVDLLVFTPPCRRRLRGLVDESFPQAELSFAVSRDSLDRIRQAVPS